MSKKLKLLFIFSLIFMVILIYIFFTRTVYWHDIYWEHELPNKTDAEYLEVWDLRFLHGNFDDEAVEKLGLDIVQSTFSCNGEMPREYSGLISSSDYKNIRTCPHRHLRTFFRQILSLDYVKIICHTPVCLHNFALPSAKCCSKIRTHFLCGQVLNPWEFLSNQIENIIDENYVIKDYDVMIHKNKAIFFWGYTYHASYNVDNKTAKFGRGYEGYPNRLYFEYENNQWIVTSVFTTS